MAFAGSFQVAVCVVVLTVLTPLVAAYIARVSSGQGVALDRLLAEAGALRRSDVLKTALLRAVSHDLRSPLTAILTTQEALRARGLTEEEHEELVADIGTEATRLSRLIDNLLDLSRLEAQAAAPRREWCSVEEVIRAAVDDLDVPPETFQLSFASDLPPVRADAAQLERAFANLLENAGRHSGGCPVSVRARDAGDRVLVRVADRGPGLPPAHHERIFEPFYRVGTADTTGHRGSGLGLAIVRGFLEVNGGTVRVESRPGHGASFIVELACDAERAATRPEADGAPAVWQATC
jgi:two-component system sensor histidine kinase KdpD